MLLEKEQMCLSKAHVHRVAIVMEHKLANINKEYHKVKKFLKDIPKSYICHLILFNSQSQYISAAIENKFFLALMVRINYTCLRHLKKKLEFIIPSRVKFSFRVNFFFNIFLFRISSHRVPYSNVTCHFALIVIA